METNCRAETGGKVIQRLFHLGIIPYAVTDKWILAQKLRILKIQFTDHMKLKKKEDQSIDASVLLRRGNKILMG